MINKFTILKFWLPFNLHLGCLAYNVSWNFYKIIFIKFSIWVCSRWTVAAYFIYILSIEENVLTCSIFGEFVLKKTIYLVAFRDLFESIHIIINYICTKKSRDIFIWLSKIKIESELILISIEDMQPCGKVTDNLSDDGPKLIESSSKCFAGLSLHMA